jgi:hypothetical protein
MMPAKRKGVKEGEVGIFAGDKLCTWKRLGYMLYHGVELVAV